MPPGGFTMEACVLTYEFDCTAFVQKTATKPQTFAVFYEFNSDLMSSQPFSLAGSIVRSGLAAI